MEVKDKEKDVLRTLFGLIPEEELPVSFRANLMQKVLQESVKAKKRGERIGLYSVIFASLSMLVLAGLSLWYLGLPKIELQFPDLSILPFYIYIGVLVLVLLFADYKFRQKYKREHQS